MRNMSFSLTTSQVQDRVKDVTRRLGWNSLKHGDHSMAVEKAMGLKKGENIKKIWECVCISNTQESLDRILLEPRRSGFRTEMEREGFPDLTPQEFIAMFCREMKVSPDTIINRIEFGYVDQGVGA